MNAFILIEHNRFFFFILQKIKNRKLQKRLKYRNNIVILK